MIMNTLPLKHKARIIAFAREFEQLSKPRELLITVPSKVRVEIYWASGCTMDVDTEYTYIEDCVRKAKEISAYNEKIQAFCKRTEDFGRKYFKDKSWLWEAVLWNYQPQYGGKFRPREYTWA
jgi:hypothetical protein